MLVCTLLVKVCCILLDRHGHLPNQQFAIKNRKVNGICTKLPSQPPTPTKQIFVWAIIPFMQCFWCNTMAWMELGQNNKCGPTTAYLLQSYWHVSHFWSWWKVSWFCFSQQSVGWSYCVWTSGKTYRGKQSVDVHLFPLTIPPHTCHCLDDRKQKNRQHKCKMNYYCSKFLFDGGSQPLCLFLQFICLELYSALVHLC